jgi:prevent-host-death family protein
MKIPSIIPITDLRQDAASILQKVRKSREPLVITQRGRPTAVMMSIEAYEKAERDHQLLMILAQGDKEIAAGEGYNLDSVMEEADRILKGVQ